MGSMSGTILDTIYPGTPPEGGSDAYRSQVTQITTMIGEAAFTFAEAERMAALIAKGLVNREIAGVLGIAEATVKHHAAAIYAALDVANRTEAAVVLHQLLGKDE